MPKPIEINLKGHPKVDRRFVNRATESDKGGQLAASIIAMARELGMHGGD